VSAAAAFRKPEIAAVLIAGVVGVLIAGLQPQLLGAMAAEGRLSAARLGQVATIELFAMGVGAGGAGAVLGIARLRPICAVATILLAAIDALTPLAGGAMILVARGAAGLAEGVLIWIAIGFIARTANPGRWAALYLLAQTLAQLALATLFGQGVLVAWGSAGGFAVLAVASLLPLFTLGWLPRCYPTLPESDGPAGLPSAGGMAALAGVLLYLAFIVGVWVYIEPLATQAGIAPATLGYAVPLSLAMQVLGAGTAALLAERLPPFTVIAGTTILDLAIVAVLAAHPAPPLFLTTIALFGFLWLFVLPFQVPLIIAADPSRRAAVLIAGAQLIGSSLGPLAASALVSDVDVRPVLWLGAGCVVVSAILMGLAGANRQMRSGRLAGGTTAGDGG
jgi:hypothetical protein